MGKNRSLFTSESVTEGHPDKIADQISDAILDAILKDDPVGRVACETLVTTGLALVAGEITTKTYVDIPGIVRQTIRDIGYTRAKYGFDYETCAVISTIDKQSPDIAMGVDTGGAGDQGLMFGFAVRRDRGAHAAADHARAQAHDAPRRGPQVEDPRVAAPRRQEPGHGRVRQATGRCASRPSSSRRSTRRRFPRRSCARRCARRSSGPSMPAALLDENTKFHINPTGRFVIGGPQGDTGLTGRKIIVDTYGGMGRHGGGAFSGKDPTKVDRSASLHGALHREERRRGGPRRHGARSSSPTRSAWPSRSRVLVDTFGTAERRPEALCGSSCASTSSSRRKASSTRSTCAAPSSGRPRPTATSAGASGVHLGAHRQGRVPRGGLPRGGARDRLTRAAPQPDESPALERAASH